MSRTAIRFATRDDLPLILHLIQALAEYERLADACVATENLLDASLFGPSPAAEVLIAEREGEPAGFALFCHNYSTFLARRGIWLEDLFVLPEQRGHGIGRALLVRLAPPAGGGGCGRLGWGVVDWETPANGLFRNPRGEPLDEWTTFRVTGAALDRLARGTPDGGH